MDTVPVNRAWQHICSLIKADTASAWSDGDLLGQFVERHDEAAFAELVRRYGCLVMSVCRRVLANRQDAEDAFQAAFLILARKASAVRRREALGGWLYAVAFRTAVRPKAANAKRRDCREVQDMEKQLTTTASAGPDEETCMALHAELNRLPANYRLVLVLHYLESRTTPEVARQLGWTGDAVKCKLARARDLLRQRLTQRGLVLSHAALGGLLANEAASAAVPAALANATARAAVLFVTQPAAFAGVLSDQAVTLATEGLKTMYLTKIKTVAAMLLVLAALASGAGAGALALQTPANPPAAANQEPKATGASKGEEAVPSKAIAVFRHPMAVATASLSADGKTAVTWTTKSIDSARQGTFGGPKPIFLIDSRPTGGRMLQVWDAAAGKELRQIALPELVVDVSLSADGRVAAVVIGDWQVLIWDVTSGKEIRKLPADTKLLRSVLLSPDGKIVAQVVGREWVEGGNVRLPKEGDNGSVLLWEAATGKELKKIKRKPSSNPFWSYGAQGITLAGRSTRLSVGGEVAGWV